MPRNTSILMESCVPRFDFSTSLSDDALMRETSARRARTRIYNHFKTRVRSSQPLRILALSDVEIPFHRDDLILNAVNIGKDYGCSVCVLNGDILHHYAVSKFAKDREVSLEEEYATGSKFCRFIGAKFKTVLWVQGNHEVRLLNFFATKLGGGILQGVKHLFKADAPDMAATLSKELGFLYAESWWAQIGPVIFAHPIRYSSVWAQNPVRTIDYFRERENICWPFEAVVQGHSHRASSGDYQGKYYLETGCLCKSPDFNVSGVQTQPRWTHAFGVVSLRKGHYDPNESRVIYLPNRSS